MKLDDGYIIDPFFAPFPYVLKREVLVERLRRYTLHLPQ